MRPSGILHRVDISLRFGTFYQPHLQGPNKDSCLLEVEPIGCPETSVKNYQPTQRKITKERRS